MFSLLTLHDVLYWDVIKPSYIQTHFRRAGYFTMPYQLCKHEVLTAVLTDYDIFWRLGLLDPEDGDSKLLQNVTNYLPVQHGSISQKTQISCINY